MNVEQAASFRVAVSESPESGYDMRPNSAVPAAAEKVPALDAVWAPEPHTGLETSPRCSTPRPFALMGLLCGFAAGVFVTVASYRPAVQPPASVMLELTGYAFAAATAAGKGAPFAPTVPLLGVPEPYDGLVRVGDVGWSNTSCAPLSAAVQVHGEYFKGPGGQQETQRQFLQNVSSQLCRDPSQSEEQYLTLLHGMIATTRRAINRHVHSAFWVKIACAHTVDETAEDEVCLGTVLQHEGYNLVEGYYVVELTHDLIIRGADFCTDPSRDELLRAWSDELEEKMAYHRSNSAFEELAEGLRGAKCPGSLQGEGVAQHAEAVAWGADGYRSVISQPEAACHLPIPEKFEFVRSDPPDALDGIVLVEQNTQVALGLAANRARSVLLSEGCIGESGGAELQATSERVSKLVARLDASGLLLPPYRRSGGRVELTKYDTSLEWEEGNNFNVDPSGRDIIVILALASVYHKLLPSCVINTNHVGITPDGGMPFMCEGADLGLESTLLHGSSGEDNPVFDLTTSTDIAKCNGDECKAAAKAVKSYQAMLGPLTKMRWDLIQLTFGTVPALPYVATTSWVKQRSCAAVTNIIDNAVAVQAQLPGVVAALRASADQLSLACVAPARTFGA